VPITPDVQLGARVTIAHPELVNLYGCVLGDDTRVGPFVEIQRGVRVGRACKISSHSFLCTGVTIEDEVFVGHGVMFVNDRDPAATRDGRLRGGDDFEIVPTTVRHCASLGSGAVILCGV
jgi:acetyltransferase-like isoleucine patch superfamily enzyme